MTAGIVITASNLESWALDGGLRRMAALGQQPLPIWDAIGQYGESSTKLRFARGYGPDRKPWIPSHRVRTQGGQTLRLKSHLMNSITHNSDNQGTSWGTNRIYAATHQFGAVIKPKAGGALRFKMPGVGFVTVKKVTIPARPFIGLNAEDGVEMLAVTNAAIDLAARNRGGN
jgi:phage virion morphogenesis protein